MPLIFGKAHHAFYGHFLWPIQNARENAFLIVKNPRMGIRFLGPPNDILILETNSPEVLSSERRVAQCRPIS